MSIRAAAILTALLAIAAPGDADAKKKHGKGWKKHGARHAWVHRVDRPRRLERDLAVLIAARPRLPDGSRIVSNVPVRRVAPAVPRPGIVAATAQRRAGAVDSFLQAHRPPLP